MASEIAGARRPPRLASAPRVQRFGRTERVLHWAHAGAFMAMLATGLVLYLPFLAQIVSARPLMKALHLVAAVAWLTALLLIPLLGDRAALRRMRADLERFDADDRAWLRRRPGHGFVPRQGRFNAGQKAHAVVQAALSVLFVVSGTLLWLGERHTEWRFGGTLALHDMSMVAGGAFVAGHVYMAFAPDTRPALQSMVDGTVPASYAAAHHAKWRPAPAPDVPPPGPQRPGAPRLTVAAVVLVAGVIAATLLVRDVFVGDDIRVPPVAVPASVAGVAANRPGAPGAGARARDALAPAVSAGSAVPR